MKITGLSSRIAATSMPLASRGVEGITTLSPGMCANHDCSVLLCWNDCPQPRPMMARITIGTENLPPEP